ncbi:MAG: hypothetical protein D3916_14250 [Candidatus Electrothrix sp. MAN1_4]|nr:hypothetical protein [Candidatus Electrothrix sp. MAN1_4]
MGLFSKCYEGKEISLASQGGLLFVVLCCSIFAVSCSGSPENKVDEKLLSDWIARIKSNYRICKTQKGCRDFVVTCVRSEEISQSEKLNGVTEEVLIGMSFVGFSNHDSKYKAGEVLTRFKLTNGSWEHDYTYNVPNTENCTYF